MKLEALYLGKTEMKRPMCALLALLAAGMVFAADVPILYRIQTIAGSALNGDGGPATLAQIGPIQGVAVDLRGNLYLSDTNNHRVRKVSSAGIISTVAGTGAAGFTGDGGPASAAQLNLPYGLAADFAGNLYIADLGNNRIRRVTPDGVISTYAGGGAASASDEGQPAVSTVLRTPRNVLADAAGNLYLSEFDGHRVRKVTPDGRIATVAGVGVAGFAGDSGPATVAQLAYPAGLALDRTGNLYIADSQNRRIRKIGLNGVVSTVAGGSSPLGVPTAVAVNAAGTLYLSDGSGPVRGCPPTGSCTTLAGAQQAGDLALDAAGILYVADGSQVRKIAGAVTTVAGDDYLTAIGDGGPATAAQLNQPSSVALDGAGNLYIADTGTQRIRQLLPSGVIQTLAGTGTADAGAHDLHDPMGVAVDATGAAIVADTGNQLVRRIGNGALVTVAGTGTAGAGPEGLPPSQTPLNSPRGICAAGDGSLYIVDSVNYRVLRLPPGGVVQTAAGNGTAGNAGDGGAARMAQLNQPSACAVDTAGNLWIADTANNRIRKVVGGTISTVAGVDGSLNAPRGVAVDRSGNLFIADTGNNRICLLAPDGTLRTIAGADQLASPGGLAMDAIGNLFVADTGNNRVRQLTPGATAAPLVSSLTIVNAASLATGPASPGELVTIFGAGIGPASAISGSFDSTNMLPTDLGGAEVLFDGVAAPLLYAQPGQINAQAPYKLSGTTTHVEVFLSGKSIATADIPVSAAAPALFPSTVTKDNPEPRGSVAIFYATGAGLTTGSNVEGQAEAAGSQPVLPVTLTVSGVAAQLLYAGSAPGTVGLLQINAVIPGGFLQAGPANVQLTVGTAVSPLLTIWLQ